MQALQNFGTVLPMVLLVIEVPVAFRPLTCSCHVVLGCSLTPIHNRLYATRRDLAWTSKPSTIDGHFVYLPISSNGTNSCDFLTKSFADGFVTHSSLVQVYNLVPAIFSQLFGLAHSVRDWNRGN